MKEKRIEFLGYFAAIFTTASFVPGAVAIWLLKPAPATAVSGLMYLILSFGLVGWLIYGVLIKSRPVVIANTATLMLSLLILLYKFVYG